MTETTETPAQESESLDNIANTIVEQQVQNFTATPEPKRQDYNPDPISDPNGFLNYSRQQSEMLNTLNDTVRNLTGKLDGYERERLQQKIDADVDKAVAQINKKLNVDPLLAEIALEKEYRKNESFKKIWDNRDKNKAAYDKALDILADKFAPLFSVRQDPQLTENQFAARKSQQNLSQEPKQKQDEEWGNLSDGEFWAKWNQKKRGA